MLSFKLGSYFLFALTGRHVASIRQRGCLSWSSRQGGAGVREGPGGQGAVSCRHPCPSRGYVPASHPTITAAIRLVTLAPPGAVSLRGVQTDWSFWGVRDGRTCLVDPAQSPYT